MTTTYAVLADEPPQPPSPGVRSYQRQASRNPVRNTLAVARYTATGDRASSRKFPPSEAVPAAHAAGLTAGLPECAAQKRRDACPH